MTTILLVEDNENQAASIKHFLESQSFVIDHCDSAEKASAKCLNSRYSLIILDWELPGASGDSFCRQYRATGGVAPVLFLTGRADLDSKVDGLSSGADDYLAKPFDLGELAARVRALLRRPAALLLDATAAAPNTVSAPGLILELDTRTAVLGITRVVLSQRETAVLEYLLRHPNRSFSSKQLLDGVWPSNSDCSEDTVRTCIRNLRKKLSAAGSNNFIKTANWSGYMIENSEIKDSPS